MISQIKVLFAVALAGMYVCMHACIHACIMHACIDVGPLQVTSHSGRYALTWYMCMYMCMYVHAYVGVETTITVHNHMNVGVGITYITT